MSRSPYTKADLLGGGTVHGMEMAAITSKLKSNKFSGHSLLRFRAKRLYWLV
jgi:hypothetical protein